MFISSIVCLKPHWLVGFGWQQRTDRPQLVVIFFRKRLSLIVAQNQYVCFDVTTTGFIFLNKATVSNLIYFSAAAFRYQLLSLMSVCVMSN